MNSTVCSLTLALAILLSATAAISQQPPSAGKAVEQAPAPQELLIDRAKKTVIFFDTHYVEDQKIKAWGGTGFLVFMGDSRVAPRGVTWLVTNKHMLHPPGRPCFDNVMVRVNAKSPLPDGSYVYELPLPVMDIAGNQRWVTDADESVDLALTVAIPNAATDFETIPAEIFATKETFKTKRINETDDVFFTGLYASYPGKKRNLPIVRHGKLALVTDERIPVDAHDPTKTEELVLAEVTSFGGNSGSPVFLRVGGIRETGEAQFGYSYYLLGVMQGFFSESADILFDITASVHGTTSQNSGIAGVIPAQKILDILATPRAKAMTDAVVANGLREDAKYPEAEELYKHTIAETESAGGLYHPDLVGTLEGYAEMLKRVGRSQEAAKILARAQSILDNANKNPATGQLVPITKSCLPSECEKALAAKP